MLLSRSFICSVCLLIIAKPVPKFLQWKHEFALDQRTEWSLGTNVCFWLESVIWSAIKIFASRLHISTLMQGHRTVSIRKRGFRLEYHALIMGFNISNNNKRNRTKNKMDWSQIELVSVPKLDTVIGIYSNVLETGFHNTSHIWIPPFLCNLSLHEGAWASIN